MYDFGRGLDQLLKTMFWLSGVGVIALLAGAVYGLYWLFNHVRFV